MEITFKNHLAKKSSKDKFFGEIHIKNYKWPYCQIVPQKVAGQLEVHFAEVVPQPVWNHAQKIKPQSLPTPNSSESFPYKLGIISKPNGYAPELLTNVLKDNEQIKMTIPFLNQHYSKGFSSKFS